MTKTRERRQGSRRTLRSVEIETRRREERRDYPRFEIALDVREPLGASRSCQGDVSPEGAAFVTRTPPAGEAVLVRFYLPNSDGPVVASGRIVARTDSGPGTQVSLVFTDIPVQSQLAIAEWAQDRVVQGKGMSPTRKRGPKPIPLTQVASRRWSRFKSASPAT